MKCVHFFIEYYGIAPVEILYELYRLRIRDTIDEMEDMLREMPVDVIESCVFQCKHLDWRICQRLIRFILPGDYFYIFQYWSMKN